MNSNYWRERSQPYRPGQREAFKVSRSKIDDFMNCPRCFWLDRRMKIAKPSSPPFNINKAIDELFKKEFDAYRKKGEQHPLQKKFKIPAKPFAHQDLDRWRENFIGVYTVHEPTNLHVFGAVDDVWVNENGELIVVDYKATAKEKEIKDLDPAGGWQDCYRRQMEVYQWLLRQNGFKVSNTGYFVYANGDASKDSFAGLMEFRIHVFPHVGNDAWIEPTLIKMKQCLESEEIPPVGKSAMGGPCEHCAYARQRTEMTLKALKGRTL